MTAPSWIETVRGLTAEATFSPGATDHRLSEAEARLAIAVPSDLRLLLSETDGIRGQYELGLVWPLARIVEDNLMFRSNPEFRELYMPFDGLLFFADAGNGDQFAYSVAGGQVRRPDIFVWNHEDDSRNWVAPDLRTYLDWWLSGKLKV